MEVQDDSGQVQDGLAGQVEESLGIPEGTEGQANAEPEDHIGQGDGSHSKESLAVQKRLKSQRRAHEREVRELHQRIGELESRMNPSQPDQSMNSYNEPAQGGGIADETIQKAVRFALGQKEAEERKAHDAEQAAHVHRSYQDFHKHLDGMGDKYDDFHDVVFGDMPYTAAMRDYALTLPRAGAGSAGEVLYKLGKNRDELHRISKLHPLDQASELAKLSHALIKGGESSSGSQSSRPLGQIKNNPVTNSHAVNEKTPIRSIRERMKSGTWK